MPVGELVDWWVSLSNPGQHHPVHGLRGDSPDQSITPTKYRYTGQLAQAEMGLDYYVARWYDPLTGHFTSADSIVPDPGKASAFDRYAYVSNNPIRYIDPNGHSPAGECGDGGGCDRTDDNIQYQNFMTSSTNRKNSEKRQWFTESYKGYSSGNSKSINSITSSSKPNNRVFGEGISTNNTYVIWGDSLFFSFGSISSASFNQTAPITWSAVIENGIPIGYSLGSDYVYGGINPNTGGYNFGIRTPNVGSNNNPNQYAVEYAYNPHNYGIDPELTVTIYPVDIQRSVGGYSSEVMVGNYFSVRRNRILLAELMAIPIIKNASVIYPAAVAYCRVNPRCASPSY
jgi:RHS repeat-associated protein